MWSHPEVFGGSPAEDDTLEMRVMRARDMEAEARQHRPGEIVCGYGLLPLGECLLGTGDPYFLTPATTLSESWVVSVPHDVSLEDWEERIEEVATFYEFFRIAICAKARG